MMEVSLGTTALTDPGERNPILALEGRGHRPTHRLRVLGGKIAGNRKYVARRPVIHDGHLPPLARVAGVGQALAHQLDEVVTTGDVGTLVAVGGKQHVIGAQRHGLGHRDSLFAERADIEGYPALPLDVLHALIEQAREQHMPQADLQFLWLQVWIPRADGHVILIQHPDHPGGQELDLRQRRRDIRTRQ